MSHISLRQIELIPFYACGLYFLATWLRVKPTRTDEEPNSRLLRYGIQILGALLLFDPRFSVGVLGARFVPAVFWIQAAGIALTYVGMAFTIWARHTLGRCFSPDVTLKIGHQLIRSGPYALVRHPIYTGITLALAGAALEIGQWRGALGFVLVLLTHVVKAKQEEQLMAAQFGEQYADYRQRSGFLVPRFR